MKLNRKTLTIALAAALVLSANNGNNAEPQKNCLLFPSITLSSCAKADNNNNNNTDDNSEEITYKFKIAEIIKNLFD